MSDEEGATADSPSLALSGAAEADAPPAVSPAAAASADPQLNSSATSSSLADSAADTPAAAAAADAEASEHEEAAAPAEAPAVVAPVVVVVAAPAAVTAIEKEMKSLALRQESRFPPASLKAMKDLAGNQSCVGELMFAAAAAAAVCACLRLTHVCTHTTHDLVWFLPCAVT